LQRTRTDEGDGLMTQLYSRRPFLVVSFCVLYLVA